MDTPLRETVARHYTGLLCALLLVFAAILPAQAQNAQMFDQYELHFSAFNSTLLQPDVAATYGITRGADKGVLTLAVRDTAQGDIAGREMLLKGETWDLTSARRPLQFQEIREQNAVYYVATFESSHRAIQWFEVYFRPAGVEQTYTHKFSQKFWVEGKD